MFHMMDKINGNGIYVIAEMSANHAGKLENALAIVHKAKEIGADCLKIQTYTADTITIDCNNEFFQLHGGLWDGYYLHDLYTDAYMPWKWQPIIKQECDKVGIDFLSTPFDNTAVDFLESINVEAYKISSFELVDIPLIEYAASMGKPMIISCGMGSIDEIQEALNTCYKVGNKQVILLKCCSEYPAPWQDMHLGNIPDMIKRFNVRVGLSDHSLGSLAAVVGVSLGACVIEKHMCLSRDIADPDSAFSMEPSEFQKMIEQIHAAKNIASGPDYTLTAAEEEQKKFRRSLFAVKDIHKGDLLTRDNIRSIRPGIGLPPKFISDLLGKEAKCDVKYGHPIEKDML